MSTKIKWSQQACYGCRRCELICSYHHVKAFQPSASSIHVVNRFRVGEIEWVIDENTCDMCQGQSQPLCVNYCEYGALEEVSVV